ncbi:MAG: sensor histidine kinase [Ktedonobacteraceae bacterium]|nr:sensor histidine kinase [Ktedonobacteraceae bacterium]
MRAKQEQTIQTQSRPLGWFLRWTVDGVIAVSYLFGLLSLEHITPVSLLALTGTYGAWLVIYHTGRRRVPLWWSLALFCLACTSLFIPLPSVNPYWRAILPTTAACLMVTITPRSLGLLLAGALWLSTGSALSLLTQQWDVGSQVLLLISFSSTCGCTATIYELAVAHRQLREYSTQVEELSVIRERNRVAREIHDTLGHALTLLSVQLETATQFEARGDPRLREELQEARRVAKACLSEVRHSVEALRLDDASRGSLQEQLRRLGTDFESTCKETQITLDLDEATHSLHPDLCLALYRCAQEALTNIRKHAHAPKVLLRLSTSEEQVELTVLDNGSGGEPSLEYPASGFGLLGMRERVALLDGRLWAGPQSQGGWRVEVVLPVIRRGQARGSEALTGEIRERVEP